LETEHTGFAGLTTGILIDINNFFNNDVMIMSSLVTNLNSLPAQKIL